MATRLESRPRKERDSTMYRKALTIIAAGMLFGACGEVNGPAVEDGPELSLAGNLEERYPDAVILKETITGKPGGSQSDPGIHSSDAPANTLEHSASAPDLDTYRTSFFVVQGEQTILILYYKGKKKKKKRPFMHVIIPDNAQLLTDGGLPALDGDRIEITLEVDPTKFLVHFGPHGSTFVDGEPALLVFNYRFAELDGGDPAALGAWYQPSQGEAWGMIPAKVRVTDRQIRIRIRHFSNYAVAW